MGKLIFTIVFIINMAIFLIANIIGKATLFFNIGFIITTVTILIGYVILRTKKEQNLTPLLEAFGAKKRWIYLSSQIKITYQGEEIILNLMPGKKLSSSLFDEESDIRSIYHHSVSMAEILIPCKTNLEFYIEKTESDNFYLDSPHQKIMNDLLLKTEFKALILKLFALGVTYILLEKKYLKVGIKCSKSTTNTMKDLPATILQLKNLILEYTMGISPISLPSLSRLPLMLCYLLPVLSMIGFLGISIYIQAISKHDFPVLSTEIHLIITALLSSPYLIFYLILAYRITSRYANRKEKFPISLIIAGGWFLVSLLLVQTLNGYLDKSFPIFIKYNIIEKHMGEGQSYLIRLGNEINTFSKDPKKTSDNSISGKIKIYPILKTIGVKEEEYNKIVPNVSIIKVIVKKGALKIPWIYDYVIYYDGVEKKVGYDYYFMGYKKYLYGDLDGALWILTEGIIKAKDNANLYYVRGMVYQKKGEIKKAYDDFQKACALGLEEACSKEK